jgi:hypothetical protein
MPTGTFHHFHGRQCRQPFRLDSFNGVAVPTIIVPITVSGIAERYPDIER